MIHADVIGERARLSPESTALIYIPTGERFSYRELNDRAIRCARLWIEHLDLSKGDRVGILAKNRVEFLDAFLAAGKTGIILVPLNTRLTPTELRSIIKDSGLKSLHYGGEFVDTVRALKNEHNIESWVAFEERAGKTDFDYGAVLSEISPSGWTSQSCDPEDLYCLLYTSGTTGIPKGVMMPHRMIAWNGYNTAICWQLREDDVSPVFTPLYHAGGLSAFLIPIFAVGGTIVLHREFDAGEVWRAVEKYKCTVVLGVPTIYKMLLEAPEKEDADLSHVRWFISGGAPLPTALIDDCRKLGVVLKQGYGLTEVGVNCFSMSCEEAIRKPGSIGKPMMLTQARLLNAHRDETTPSDVGELLLRGPHVCKGYWNNPGATALAIDREGWFHTGDIARCDKEGFYYIVGRSKDMFISGGVNVYPAEIESELLKHEAIRDVAVIGVPDATWGEVGVAFVVSVTEVTPSPGSLKNFLASRIAKYKIPREFFFVKALPRTPYGKVRKAELQQMFHVISPKSEEV
jgi:fatty-acyl-CoA synthase